MKFKVGDKVKLNRTLYSWPVNSIGTVAIYDSEYDHGVEVKFDNIHPKESCRDRETWFVTWEVLELVTKQENNMTFKVGDKVKIAKTSQYYGRKEKGNPQDEVGTVDAVYGSDGYGVQWSLAHNSYTTKDLELAEETIEVGDTIEVIDNRFYNTRLVKVGSRGTVNSVEGDQVYANFGVAGAEDQVGSKSQLKLVSKKGAQEVTYYELVTALPGIPVGTKSEKITATTGATMYKFANGDTHNAFSEVQIKDTTFFKPVYKKLEVTLDISGSRKVIVNKDTIDIVGHDVLTHVQFSEIYNYVFPKTKFKGYKFGANNVQVGCQSYTKEDIQLVKTTIQAL